jgi:hypothetical protein
MIPDRAPQCLVPAEALNPATFDPMELHGPKREE